MHSIVARLQPSSEQAPAVFADGCDVLVVAGAGTGKTRTLVARMLHLLAAGMQLRRIVAVTFTVKAAREMRNRLREEIQRYLAASDLPAAEQRRWLEVDAALDAARIGTIHGLCTELLRNHPAEAAIDPRFGVLDEAQSALLLQDAIAETLGWTAEDAQTVELFQFFTPAGLQALLAQLLGNPQVAETLLGQNCWATWPQTVGDLLQRRFLLDPAVQATLAALQELRQAGHIAAAHGRGDELAADLLRLLDLCAQLLEPPALDDLPLLCAGLAELRTLLKGNRGRAPLWRPIAPPKEEVKQLRDLYDEALPPLLKGTNPALDRQLAACLPHLQRLFDFARGRYTAAKRERGVLDFEDLEQKALDLLRTHPHVRSRWQHETGALLVDEFQDTNERQRDLVRLLNGESQTGGGGRLFLVGDAKQSIYRFRGADVQVFRSEQVRMAGGSGQSYELAVSYRTHAPLLDGLNRLLAAVLGEEDDPQRPWRAPFQSLRASRTACAFGLSAPYIEVQLAAGTKGSGALPRAASALAARLAQLVAESAQVGGGLHYGHIAILCRSYRGFGPYEDALEAANIPYVTVAGRGFYTRPEIRDLLNALAALSDPYDDLALAGLLRSPAIGFSDVELFHLRYGAGPGDETGDGTGGVSRPLWPALQAADDDASRRAATLIAGLHSEAGRIGVADLLKRLLDATDYSAKLILAGDGRAARNVAKLLDDARRSGLVSTGAFLETIQHLRDVGGREGEARADDAGSVQIMTVHQAKGLQFPVVVIGDAAGSGGGKAGAALFDPLLGVTPTLTDGEGDRPLVCRLAAASEQRMAEAESDRLLYVAATRAADKLILNGHVRVAANGALRGDGWLGQVLSQLGVDQVPNGYAEDGDKAHQLDARLGADPVLCSLYEPGFGRELSDRSVPSTDQRHDRAEIFAPALLSVLQQSVQPSHAGEDRRVWRVAPSTEHTSAPAWIVGRLVHETIARWRFPLDASFAAWAAARCHDFGLADPARVVDAEWRARRYLERLQASPIFRQIDGADQRLHEVPYTCLVEGRSESGSIDLLYRCGQQWTVVDFKTDHIHTPAEREQIIGEQGYDLQLARYVTAVEALLGQRPAALLCLLDDAGQVRTWPAP